MPVALYLMPKLNLNQLVHNLSALAQNKAQSICTVTMTQQSDVGCCYMFYKCAMKNLHIRTLFYMIFLLNVGAAQLPLICKHSD